jgi:hypothetical protein
VKITITVESDEYAADGLYQAAQLSTFTHDTDVDEGSTWDTIVETFKRALTAAGYIGHEERLVVLEHGDTVVREGNKEKRK